MELSCTVCRGTGQMRFDLGCFIVCPECDGTGTDLEERDRRAACFDQLLKACEVGRDFIARTIAESRTFATGKSLADIQLETVTAAIDAAKQGEQTDGL